MIGTILWGRPSASAWSFKIGIGWALKSRVGAAKVTRAAMACPARCDSCRARAESLPPVQSMMELGMIHSKFRGQNSSRILAAGAWNGNEHRERKEQRDAQDLTEGTQ